MSATPGDLRDAALGRLAGAWPLSVDGTRETERALSFVGWEVDAETVVAAGHAAGTGVALVGVAVAALVALVWVPVAAALGVVVGYAVHRGPVWVARVRRTAALGEAPGVVVRAVLRMRIEPTAESAAAFAARTGSGRLAASLAAHVRRARATPRSGLSTFADEWAAWFPALRRATGLVVAAADAPAGDRDDTLDRATTTVLDGARDRMAAFADEVRAPATALYAFGVLLPLALVAVLPAARVAGVGLSLRALVIVYDLSLPAVVLAAGAWLLVRRPVAFPPPSVGRSHPSVPSRRWPAVALAGGVAAGSLVALPRVLPAWTAPVGAVGLGAGAGLVWYYRPVVAVQRRVRAVEEGLPDALHLIGRRVAEGEAVETAVERTATELSDETGRVLGRAARTGRQLRVDLRAALLGPDGALADVPSPRARGAAALLSVAAEEGEPAGRAVMLLGDHLDDLESVEREGRRELARVTGTLRHTAAVFGPLVAGATVALAAGLDALGGRSAGVSAVESAATVTASPLPVAGVGSAVGTYVLFLAAALTALSTGLERGLDGPLVGYRVGWALCSATAVFFVAFRATGLLV